MNRPTLGLTHEISAFVGTVIGRLRTTHAPRSDSKSTGKHPPICRLARAFFSEVDAGSRQENASKQKIEPPFRFNRNGKGSRWPGAASSDGFFNGNILLDWLIWYEFSRSLERKRTIATRASWRRSYIFNLRRDLRLNLRLNLRWPAFIASIATMPARDGPTVDTESSRGKTTLK